MPIGFVERLDGIFEIMKLTELMGGLWEDKRNGTANGFFPIGEHAFHWHLQCLQQSLGFLQQRRYIALSTAE